MADTTGIRSTQIKVADKHGTQTWVQMSDDTGTNGNLAKYNADGSLTDAGISAAAVSTIVSSVGPWVKEIPSGTLNGTSVTFTLSFTPIAGSLTLFVNIVQSEGTDFTISGSTITFTIAPKARDAGWFLARYQH